ncbi:uncharacterized protein METZ01_LOCUS12345 [marine metagenome]|uniref:Uncharacterized protein n=1 Tax=marine metagenome TaxID=408172 RepID=A0A381NXZ2_9ZZZZ
MAIIKVTFNENGTEYYPDPNGKFELDDMASHPHRFQVKDGVLVDIFDGMSDFAIIAKIKEEADAELARKLVLEKDSLKRRVKMATGNLIAATDWKLDRARDTGADNTDILAERQALRDKSNALEDVIDALKDEDEMNEFGWSDITLEKK